MRISDVINSIVQKQYEINDETSFILIYALDYILHQSFQLQLNYEITQQIMNVINILPCVVRSSNSYYSTTINSYFVNEMMNKTKILSQLISQDLIRDETVDLITSEIRIVISSFFIYENKTIYEPLSDVEKYEKFFNIKYF